MAVILLLVVVWGGVGAWWYMNRPEGRAADSIGTFRQQLRVLERTGPVTVPPAFKMRTQDLGVFGARALPRSPVMSTAATRRRQTMKRRRDVFYSLLAGIGGSGVIGFIPGLAMMWYLSAALLAALVLYVVALVQMQAAAQERTQRRVEYATKVRHLPARVTHSAAHPAYAQSAN